ncbi:MAG: complex I NDUFA9 subunit family protein [Rhodospirillaceae bacterium]|nr:MAG: complex I NDUFA9 subunit family protein [Rhodospirillaceae bacterium]
MTVGFRTTRVITVFGGSGFLGRYVVRRLAASGARVRVAVRNPEAAAFLTPLGDVGQIVPVQANIRDDASVARAVQGADAVINLVGILFERGHQTFRAVHVEGAERIAAAAREAKTPTLIQISSLAADPKAASHYAQTKAAGETAVRAAFPKAVLLRPGVIFGAEDLFFNRFAAMACLAPFLPLIGGGKTRLQPVAVWDVADAIACALDGHDGEIIELGGPETYTFRALMEAILKTIERRRALLPVPFAVARLAAFFLEFLPVPPLTRDQIRLLENDNVVSRSVKGFADLGIAPTPLEIALPNQLARFRPGGGKTHRA